VVDVIAGRCTESASGARNVENILSRTLLPELSGEVLSRLAANTWIEEVTVVTEAGGGFAYNLR
jgi:type VI secretion system protein VasG